MPACLNSIGPSHSRFSRTQQRIAKHLLPLALLALFTISAEIALQAQPLTANFDSFANGYSTTVLTTGGITFSNLDCRSSQTHVFSIQSTTAALPGFSPPDYLTFDGYTSSTGGYFLGRFGSADILFRNPGTSASIGVLGTTASYETSFPTLTLEAFRGNSLVASNTITIDVSSGFVIYKTLSVSGEFDRLRLEAGTQDTFIGLDNVQVMLVPEPKTGLLLISMLFACSLRLPLATICRACWLSRKAVKAR